MKKRFYNIIFLAALLPIATLAQVDYSVISVDQESGTNFTRITTDNDYVCMPQVKRSARSIDWFTNRILDISADGTQLAYLSARNNTTNIFIKDIGKQGASVQRTKRQNVLDFSFSPDGKNICFSEKIGNLNQIYQTSATNGYICRQITTSNTDYSPVYSMDMKNIFFARMENNGASIWSYDITNNFLSSYTAGINPCPTNESDCIICSRINNKGHGEIWRINYQTGIEECILSDGACSFTTPSISPDGQWIVMVGSSRVNKPNGVPYYNTDIFACHTDGTEFMQLTYHVGDDLSPVWSKDGRSIYFISQRGSQTGVANVWKMDFLY